MNAAGHYRAAERLLAEAAYPKRYSTGVENGSGIGDLFAGGTVVLEAPMQIHDQTLAAAQVHATLALAGATFLAGSVGYELASGEFADVLIGADE
jgi:hypothetical protein